jgi:Lrp/AsnC family leucine-responsive transcriptional regulator
MEKIDDLDRAILRELQMDCRQSTERIAETVSLSPTAVQRRIKRMREEKVILAEQARLNPEALGLGASVTVLVQVCMGQGGEGVISAFKRQAQATPEVQQCYYLTGEVDFVLVVVVASMSEYEALTRRLFMGNAHIRKFSSMVVMDAVKLGLQLPV